MTSQSAAGEKGRPNLAVKHDLVPYVDHCECICGWSCRDFLDKETHNCVKAWKAHLASISAQAAQPMRKMALSEIPGSLLNDGITEVEVPADHEPDTQTLEQECRAIADEECARYTIDGIDTWRMVHRIITAVLADRDALSARLAEARKDGEDNVLVGLADALTEMGLEGFSWDGKDHEASAKRVISRLLAARLARYSALESLVRDMYEELNPGATGGNDYHDAWEVFGERLAALREADKHDAERLRAAQPHAQAKEGRDGE